MASPRRISLARWTPDAPPDEPDALLVAKNCVPFPGGRAPYPSLVSMNLGALAAYCRGAIGTADRDGASENFAGDATKLYRVIAGVETDVSRLVGGAYASDRRWEFHVFFSPTTNARPLVFATNYVDVLQVFEIGSSTNFVKATTNVGQPTLGSPAGDGAPKARHMAVISDFLVLGDTSDIDDGHVANRWWWSAQGNSLSWPAPRSATAKSALSGNATIPGDGGAITRICSGSEAGFILQEKAVHRVDFVGGETVFERHRVDGDRGAQFHHLAVPFGRRVLFWTGTGWWVNDGTESVAVGNGVIDDFFRNDFVTDFVDRCSTLFDPSGPRVLIGYTGSGNNGGVPNRVLVYDFAQQEWGILEFEHECLTAVRNPGPNLSMDRTPSPIPDTLTGGWDDVVAGLSFPGAFGTDHQLGTLTGPSLAATLETGDLELNPGRRAQVLGARPTIVTPDLSLQLSRRGRFQDSVGYGPSSALRPSGHVPLRGDGRLHRVRINLPSGWGGPAQFLDIDYRPTGGR